MCAGSLAQGGEGVSKLFHLPFACAQLPAGRMGTYIGCQATMCCPHLCHLLGESRSFRDLQGKCVELGVILQADHQVAVLDGCLAAVLWDSMCMVLLSWGIGIAFLSHCHAAVSAGDPFILLFF